MSTYLEWEGNIIKEGQPFGLDEKEWQAYIKSVQEEGGELPIDFISYEVFIKTMTKIER